jgi:hypothetical protein
MGNVLLTALALAIFLVIAGDLVIEERRRRRTLRAFFAHRDR